MEVNFNVLLTSVVISALITSLINIVISLYSNHCIRKIEEKKKFNAVSEYRYKRLYDIWFNWEQFTSFDPNAPENINLNENQIAYRKIFDGFFDDSRRYKIIKPLFDNSINVDKIEQFISEGDKLVEENLIFAKDENGKSLQDFDPISKKKFIINATNLSLELEKAVNKQLDVLLKEKI